MDQYDTYAQTTGMLTPELQEEMTRKQRKASAASAIIVAVMAHVVILVLLGLIAFLVYPEPVPQLVVSTEGNAEDTGLKKQEFASRVLQDRPSAPSAPMTQTLLAAAPSAISLPVTDVIVDDPMDLGITGTGDGFGFGGNGSGRGGGAKFLGISGGGGNIILVIDTSSSMPGACGQDGLDAIQKEIARTINALKPGTLFNIICYADDCDAFKEKSIKATAEMKREAIEFMAGYFGRGPYLKTRTAKWGSEGVDRDGIKYIPLPPDKVSGLEGTTGGSRIDLGLVAAMDRKPTTIFCLSDGEPSTALNGQRLSHKEILDLVVKEYQRLYANKSLTIHTVSIKGAGAKFLKDISKKFKGKHKDIKPDKI